MRARKPHSPTQIYAYDLGPYQDDGRDVCESGVIVDDPDAATTTFHRALSNAPPGTRGILRRVVLHPLGRSEYETISEIHAWHDEHARGIVWGEVR